MERPKISVIIPIYNVEKYLQQCLDSVLNQTYQAFELILVNDGSTDQSLNICETFANKDSRVKVLHQKNSGVSCARNNGLNVASGKYIYFLDSDDWLEKDALEILVTKSEEYDAQVVFFDAISFTEEKNVCVKQRYTRDINYGSGKGITVFERLQKRKDYHAGVPLLFVERNFLMDNSISFETGIVYEDMIFTFQVFCLANRVLHVNKQLYHRRYRLGSVMMKKRTHKNFISSKIVYDRVNNFVKINKLNSDSTREYIVRCAFNALNIYSDIDNEEKLICKNEYDSLKKDILNHGAYESWSLRARCYGKFLWILVRCIEKMRISDLRKREW